MTARRKKCWPRVHLYVCCCMCRRGRGCNSRYSTCTSCTSTNTVCPVVLHVGLVLYKKCLNYGPLMLLAHVKLKWQVCKLCQLSLLLFAGAQDSYYNTIIASHGSSPFQTILHVLFGEKDLASKTTAIQAKLWRPCNTLAPVFLMAQTTNLMHSSQCIALTI